MLVLSRRVGQRIVIDPHGPAPITITVVEASRNKTSLGFEAPRDVPIYREELLPVNSPTSERPHPMDEELDDEAEELAQEAEELRW